MKPVFTTFTGLMLDYSNPEGFHFVIDDISHGLSQTCRYGGQCDVAYNVAQHSIMVSKMVPPGLAMEALLHDAVEAYMCDIPKPLKVLLPDYVKLETRMEIALFKQFGLSWPMDPLIKSADTLACIIEQANITKTEIDLSYLKRLWDQQEAACGFRLDPSMMIVGYELPEVSSNRFMDRYSVLYSELYSHNAVELQRDADFREMERV
jgi:hypothetical protein